MNNDKLFAIVGQNPKSKVNIKHPFKGTRSLTKLTSWLKAANVDIEEVALFNAVDVVGKVSEKLLKDPLNIEKLRDKLKGFKYVVSAGNFALMAVLKCKLDNVDHYNIPHPSGLNRKLNLKDADTATVHTLSTVKVLSKKK